MTMENGAAPHEARGGGGAGAGRSWTGFSTRDAAAEARRQFWLAGPLVACNVMERSIQVISLIFVGRLGVLPLSCASMATAFAGVTGFSVLMGMGSALDTLAGQAFGAKQYAMLGTHAQRAMLVLLVTAVPLAVLFAFTGDILVALGMDREISAGAGTYARWMIPSLFAYAIIQCETRFLQAQNVVLPMMLSYGAATGLSALACWAFVFKLGLGLKGAAMASSTAYWINVVLLASYIKLSPRCTETWVGFSGEGTLHGVLVFVKLAIPSALMVCVEAWSFEAVVLLSGRLPNPKLETSALSICLNTSALAFMIPFGIGAAVSTRVSNELGAGDPRVARLAVCVAELLGVTEGSLVCSLMVAVRHVWGKLYSGDEEVVKYVATMLPFVGLILFLDGTQSVLTGTARGCGWQKLGAVVNLGAYYIVGLPISVVLAFVFHLRGKGLWMGILCALVVQVLLLLVITLRTNWEKEASKAKDRSLLMEDHADEELNEVDGYVNGDQ